MKPLFQTPSQTVGPYFAYGLAARQYRYPWTQIADGNLITDPGISGERITIIGCVYDGNGTAIDDAMIEIWQADVKGNYQSSNFKGFGRMGTGTTSDKTFRFDTIKPGSVNGAAPHINVIVFMRGLLIHAYTRIYFPDEPLNDKDVVLLSVDKGRRNTLIAKGIDGPGEQPTANNQQPTVHTYRFDIFMQGPTETVFFDA